MQSDMRETSLFREVRSLCETLRRPGTGQINDASEVHASPDGAFAVFSGSIFDKLEGAPPTRICRVNLASGDTRVLTFGPNADRLAKFSPDGDCIAFLSDRKKAGDFQLYLLDPVSGAARPTPEVDGWVEYLHWSPDGKRILLGVAGHGADVAGGQGAITSKQLIEDKASWMPTVQSGDEDFHWRRPWVYERATDEVRQISHGNRNIWEAVWCGSENLAAVVSPGPGEGLWYDARLHCIEVDTGSSRELYIPKDQLGWPAASPLGKYLAVVEAFCSDRWIVAGDLQLIETASGKSQRVDCRGVDITYIEWRSEREVLLAGHRGFETVVAHYDVQACTFAEVWRSDDLTTGGRYAAVSGLNSSGDCVLIGESFVRAPEIAVIRQGVYRTVKSFDLGYTDEAKAIEAVDRVTWHAPDGLEIQGWLLRPHGPGPYPVIMNVHGGPVWHWRPAWLGRPRSLLVLMLIKHGYAVFFPNPRGSAGRGQDFARRVKGDLNGADAHDCLSGLDSLVGRGLVDPRRIGVTGLSYGGGMSSWLVTQDSRFAAAVPVAPHTNQVTEHLISNIPHFVALFLDDHYTNAGGKYFERSPVMHAHKVRTPTLNICGSLDRCTPPEEAMQFHRALQENGVKSVLVTYPEEGHGIHKFPAAIDYTARVVCWFQEHMCAQNRQRVKGER
jgi:dipeptidyl aminopeptidase/acylaminoacyl peptidase